MTYPLPADRKYVLRLDDKDIELTNQQANELYGLRLVFTIETTSVFAPADDESFTEIDQILKISKVALPEVDE